jgi:orotate phosphoribosyltransferase
MASPDTSLRNAQILWDSGAMKHVPDKPITFKSGFVSPIYCDNRWLLRDVPRRRMLTESLVEQCRGVDAIVGVATGGLPWAAWVSDALEVPMFYLTDDELVGGGVDGMQVAVMEDTVSTGESAAARFRMLWDAGATIDQCACIFSWDFPQSKRRFNELKVPLRPLIRSRDVLRVGVEQKYLTRYERRRIKWKFTVHRVKSFLERAQTAVRTSLARP